MSFKSSFKKASPTILCIAAIGGVILTAISAAKAAPKAKEELEKAKEEKGDKLSTVEKAVIVGKEMAPTIIIGSATILCMVGCNGLNRRNQALLATAYPLLERTYKEYKDEVKRIFGEEGHQKVMEGIAEKKVKCNPPRLYAPGGFSTSELGIDDTEEPEIVRTFYDTFSQRCFESTLSNVLQAEYHVNRNINLGKFVAVNEWYDFLGIDGIENGDEMFWWQDLDNEFTWLDFNHYLGHLEDGMEVVFIEACYDPTIPMEDE